MVDIPEDDIAWLDRKAREQGKSRTALVREAVSHYRSEPPAVVDKSWIERGYGYWKDRDDIGDSVEYQRAMREDRDFD